MVEAGLLRLNVELVCQGAPIPKCRAFAAVYSAESCSSCDASSGRKSRPVADLGALSAAPCCANKFAGHGINNVSCRKEGRRLPSRALVNKIDAFGYPRVVCVAQQAHLCNVGSQRAGP